MTVEVLEHEVGPEPHQSRIVADVKGTVLATWYKSEYLIATDENGFVLPAGKKGSNGSGGPRIEIPLNMRIQAFYDDEPRLAQLAIDNSVGISCDTLKEGRKREADMRK